MKREVRGPVEMTVEIWRRWKGTRYTEPTHPVSEPLQNVRNGQWEYKPKQRSKPNERR